MPRAKLKATRAEIAEAKRDSAYWREVGELLNLKLYGFTNRYRGFFYDREDELQEVQIPGWLANRIVDLRKE